ncbi:MAG TPA: Rieske (2Fe-2S) protein, partial [Nitrososphaeraceae archaeon]|nr:Rieske (2Fe-2S) protein [Nitrososphaeraceae archaeon]
MKKEMLHRVCERKEIKDNSMLVFTINKTDILIGRRNGKLFACNNSCPHRGASLSKGEFNGDNIVCYMHGYEYNIWKGTLEKMKSWKIDPAWREQSSEWMRSDDLKL